MPRRRPSQRGVSRKLRLEVLERRDFLAVDLMPLEVCTDEDFAAPPEVVSIVASDYQEIALEDGKRAIIQGGNNGVLVHPDGTEEQFVGIEVVRDGNSFWGSPDGAIASTLVYTIPPAGKQLLGSYMVVLRETEGFRHLARYDVYGRLPVVELEDGKRLIFERDDEGVVVHPDGTEQQFVGIEVIHNRNVSDRNGVANSTDMRWSTSPRKPLIGTYTEVLWESGQSRITAHYDVYGLLPGEVLPPPAEPELPPLPEISPVPASPSFQVPVLDWPEIGTPAGDRLVYHNSDEGPKLTRMGELPPGTFYWVADPPAPATPPTPEEIENAVVTFADRSGNVATTTIAHGPLPGVWFFYWVQDARIRLPTGWFDGADITWDHTVIHPPLPPALPPA